MTTEPQPQHDDSTPIERLIDDAAEGQDQEALERRFNEEPALRKEFELQERIDQALKAQCSPPAATGPFLPQELRTAAEADTGEEGVTTHRGPWRLYRVTAVAASIALLILCGWIIWSTLQPPSQPDGYAQLPMRSIQQEYEWRQARNFPIDWLCETEKEFIDAVEHKLSDPLRLDLAAPGAEVVGIAYTNTLSPRTIGVVARVADGAETVMVFVDRRVRLEAGQHRSDTTVEGLNEFSRELGPFVLYEVSPLDEPQLLDDFSLPNGG